LDYVQAKYREIIATLKQNPVKTYKGPVILLATGTPTKKKFTKPFKKACSLCGKQGYKSVDCYTRPENLIIHTTKLEIKLLLLLVHPSQPSLVLTARRLAMLRRSATRNAMTRIKLMTMLM
jgi:hypothetical protein